MRVVITGLPQSGRQELFSVLTGIGLEQIVQKPLEAIPGACDVRDKRVAALTALYNPKKVTYTKIEYLLLPDFSARGPAKSLLFSELKNCDEICWVARGETAAQDVAAFISELIISDLVLVEKRLETIEKDQQRKFLDAREKEKSLMLACKEILEAEKPLRGAFAQEQLKVLKTYQFLTLKPMVIVINVAEDKINDPAISEEIQKNYNLPCVQVSAALEEEINQLAEGDRAEFLAEMGIREPALEKMNRAVYEGLGLISFFTVGTDEVRAWPVRRGALAPEAGGVIHSDIERGFVRAELMKYDDLIAAGSEAKVKELGKFSLKGKDYLVEDGDVLSFRFSI
jgi:ribosome-binding ATPase YchF (GTP1/OBG family)